MPREPFVIEQRPLEKVTGEDNSYRYRAEWLASLGHGKTPEKPKA